MSNELLINFLGIVIGTFGGIMASSKLTTFRLEQLEKKVDKHNSVMERTFILEEKVKVANHRIENLEEGMKEVIK